LGIEKNEYFLMSPKKRDENGCNQREEAKYDATDLTRTLEDHIIEFDEWRSEWARHREEAKLAMHRIALIEPSLKTIADNIGHLKCLPEIQQQITVMNVGLTSQNSALIGQADKLIGPAQRAQTGIQNLLSTLLLIAAAIFIIILLRETDKGFKAGPFEMTQGHKSTINEQK